MKSILLTVVLMALSVQADGKAVTLSKKEQNGLLQLHNDVRSSFGIPELKWSKKLADKAADVASSCEFKHSGGEYGENLAASGPVNLDHLELGQHLVGLWMEEKSVVDLEDNWDCAFRWKKTCGHYSQVVWSGTESVGCAISHCKDLDNFLVCEYSPRGNLIGKRPF